jgi:hypothetical protein
MPQDILTIEVLPDGSFKIETDKVSQANHVGAEGLIREMAKLAGGKSERMHRHGNHGAHTHNHEGEHEHH